MRAVRIFLFYFRRFTIDTSPHLFEELRYTQSLVLRKSVDNLGLKCCEPRIVLSALPAQRVLLLALRPIILQMTRAELAAEGVKTGHRLSAIGHRTSGIGYRASVIGLTDNRLLMTENCCVRVVSSVINFEVRICKRGVCPFKLNEVEQIR